MTEHVTKYGPVRRIKPRTGETGWHAARLRETRQTTSPAISGRLSPELSLDATGRPGHRIGGPIGWIVLIASAFGPARPLLASAPGPCAVLASGCALADMGMDPGLWCDVTKDSYLGCART